MSSMHGMWLVRDRRLTGGEERVATRAPLSNNRVTCTRQDTRGGTSDTMMLDSLAHDFVRVRYRLLGGGERTMSLCPLKEA